MNYADPFRRAPHLARAYLIGLTTHALREHEALRGASHGTRREIAVRVVDRALPALAERRQREGGDR